MLPYRAVRAYFASFLIIALCVCGFKHAILMTRLGLTSQTVDAEQLPQLMADIRQSTAPVVGEMPSVSSLSPQLSLEEAGALLRQDAEAELKARDAGGTGLSTVSNETTRVDSAKTDRNAATFGATADDRCRPETMGVPPRVAEQCNENADMSGGSSSSKGHQACFLLTCYNMVNDPSIADKLSAIAADFEASHPARIPTDDEMSAMGSRCDVWRSKYGFDNMPPVSRDEEDFPLAFNVLAHQHAHQVDSQ